MFLQVNVGILFLRRSVHTNCRQHNGSNEAQNESKPTQKITTEKSLQKTWSQQLSNVLTIYIH